MTNNPEFFTDEWAAEVIKERSLTMEDGRERGHIPVKIEPRVLTPDQKQNKAGGSVDNDPFELL